MLAKEKGLAFDLAAGNLLLVDRFQDLAAALHRTLGVALTFAQLQQSLRLLKLLLVLLQRLVDVFAIFRINDQHNEYTSFGMI